MDSTASPPGAPPGAANPEIEPFPETPEDFERYLSTISARLGAAEDRLRSSSEWATKVTSDLRGIHAGLQVLNGGQEALAQQIAEIAAAPRPQVPMTPPTLDPVMGYQPTPEQLAVLFTALAEWQAAAPELTKTGRASFPTTSGGEASYDYATPGDVSALARTAGRHGLSHWHREIVLESWSLIRTYLVHSGGGYVYSDVPLLQKDNKMLSPIQLWAVANTAAKRLGILSVLGILPGDSDDAGNPVTGQGRSEGRAAGGRGRTAEPGIAKPPPLDPANIKRVGATTRPASTEPVRAAAAGATAAGHAIPPPA